MKIVNNKLVAEAGEKAISLKPTTNQGGNIVPKYLIIHFTAAKNAKSSIEWFKNPTAKASAHLIIAKDGSITQMVDFNKKAWHAGVSQWANIQGLNDHSIGIEIDNPGKLNLVNGKWISWFGTEYPASQVLTAKHKHSDDVEGWHIYTEAQIQACIKVSQLLIAKYNLLDVLGHEDISPNRKNDPGPAFPMESFKSSVLGRSDDVADIFKTNNSKVNFRKGPGTQFETMGELAIGTKVEFIRSNNGWFNVFLVKKPTHIAEKVGWIMGSLLTKV